MLRRLFYHSEPNEHVTRAELERILAKPHDDLSPDERALLLSLYDPPEVQGTVQPISRQTIEALLAQPLQQLTDEDRATLIAFRGTLQVAEFLLPKTGRRKDDAA
jgi:hypothetical protein